MRRLKNILILVVCVGAAGLIAYPLYAHCGKCAADGKKIATQLEENEMTLARAIASAERHSKGRAITVISELDDRDKVGLEVYCMAGDKIMKCLVDGTAGSVTDMKEVDHFPITEDKEHTHKPGEPGLQSRINNQIVEVGCGKCIYSMRGVTGCELAVRIDGKSYPVTGADHVNAHQFCTAPGKATVSGRIEGDKFVATKVEVEPGS